MLLPLLLNLAGLAVLYFSGAPTPTFVAAIALSAIGAIWQYIANRPFVYRFSFGTWLPDGADFAISVPAQKHHHGKNVKVEVTEQLGHLYQKVMCDEQVDRDGNVTVRASQPFVGKMLMT